MIDENDGLKTNVTMTISIDGNWTTDDFSKTLTLVTDLYLWFQLGYALTMWRHASLLEAPRVASIHYGSPGNISIIGLGEVMKQVKEFLMYLMDRDLFREQKQLEIKLLRLKVQQQRKSISIDALRWHYLEEMLEYGHFAYVDNVDEKKERAMSEAIEFMKNHRAILEQLEALYRDGKIEGIKLDEGGEGSERELV